MHSFSIELRKFAVVRWIGMSVLDEKMKMSWRRLDAPERLKLKVELRHWKWSAGRLVWIRGEIKLRLISSTRSIFCNVLNLKRAENLYFHYKAVQHRLSVEICMFPSFKSEFGQTFSSSVSVSGIFIYHIRSLVHLITTFENFLNSSGICSVPEILNDDVTKRQN